MHIDQNYVCWVIITQKSKVAGIESYLFQAYYVVIARLSLSKGKRIIDQQITDKYHQVMIPSKKKFFTL